MVDTKFLAKKCPECHAHLHVEVKKCYFCGNKVRRANKWGIAKRPINWLSYLNCLMAWAVFFFFLWWSFFPDL